MNKLSELTSFANLLEIFTFSLIFPGKKLFQQRLATPSEMCLLLAVLCCTSRRSFVTLNFGTKLEFYF